MFKAISISSSTAFKVSAKQLASAAAMKPACTFSTDNGNDANNKPSGNNPDREDLLKKAEKFGAYVHKTNYNFEQHSKYTKNVGSALQQLEDDEVKLQNSTPFDLLPRRKRRVYDRPLIDLDITNYEVWRCYDKSIFKAFGEGQYQTRNDRVATREYDFEDSNLDAFLVYDYKATTETTSAQRKNHFGIEGEAKVQKSSTPTVEEFWNSDEPHMFRVNCSNYADFHKFRKWIVQEVEKRASEKSYEDKILERFGPYEMYNDYAKKYEMEKDPSVFKFDRTYYLEKGKKYTDKEIQSNPYLQPITPAKQMDDKHRVSWPYQWNPKPTSN